MGGGADRPGERFEGRGRRLRFLGRLGLVFGGGIRLLAAAVLALVVVLAGFLLANAWPAIVRFGPGFLSGTIWGDQPGGPFGAWPAIAGTLLTSALALLFAVPIGLGVALFASELAPRWLRAPLAYFVDLGAAIPSIVYGFWAIAVLVPFLGDTVEPGLSRLTHGRWPFAGPTTGGDLLAASVVLAIMIVPTIAALSREALRAVPRELREGALGVGANRWEATRLAVLGPAAPGIAGSIVLGLGRALGETIAVAMVFGGVYEAPTSLFSRGATIPSWLVTQFLNPLPGLDLNALYELATILLAVSIVLNVGARLLIRRLEAPRRSRRGARWRTAPTVVRAPAGTDSFAAPAWWPRIAERGRARRRWRAVVQGLVLALVVGAVLLAAYPLASLIETTAVHGGVAVVRPSFYTSTPPPSCGIGQTNCPLGGVGPEIEGTLVMLGLAALIAIPVGLLVGVYISEYRQSRLARATSLVTDVLVGVPTILLGVFVFAVVHTYDQTIEASAIAGAAALGLLMVPIVTRATEVALRTVPASVREGALALGFPRHRVTLRVVLGSCRPALVTGNLLAVMRAGGETAALLLTAGTSGLWMTSLTSQTGALSTFIWTAFESYSSPNYTTDAWGAALVLLLMMAVVSLAARLALRSPGGPGSV